MPEVIRGRLAAISQDDLRAVVERISQNVLRSDHAPFWRAGIPAIMWTDTAEFRNPHYHRATDLPKTLDYEFLAAVTGLLAHAVLSAL